MHSPTNTRVLVIDDEEVVRDSIREVLLQRKQDTTRMDRAAMTLFDDENEETVEFVSTTRPASFDLEIDLSEAASGMDGLQKVRSARDAGRPFAVIFLDMRMPGWDGMETATRIREIDRSVEIIFVTAYSDHSIDEIVKKAGANVGYHCKPFCPEEIRQIASKGIYDWNKIHKLERLVAAMGRLRTLPTDVEPLCQNVLEQIAEWVGSRSVLLARGSRSRGYSPLVGCGPLGESERAEHLLRELTGQLLPEGVFRFEGARFHALSEGDIIVIWEDDKEVNTEKTYLLRLFVEHAFQIIENAKLHEKVFQGEKLSSVGRAIGTVAHDLRGPLGNIQSALDIVKMSLDDPDQVVELLELVGQAADDAMALVSDILDFTKGSSIEKELFEVEELFNSVRRQTNHVLGVNRTLLRSEYEPGLCLLGDAKKLGRVLINLVVNAAEALGSRGGANSTIVLSARSSGGTAEIEVADNGPGIPRRIRSKLFEPFVTHGKSNGTGLGLAIARQIVEAHGGELSFTTGDDGTAFAFKLPHPQRTAIMPALEVSRDNRGSRVNFSASVM